jgi:hypothetical protein
MSAAVARMFLSQAPNIAGGAIGFSVFSDTIDILTKNPIIPIAIMSIVLIVVMKKK